MRPDRGLPTALDRPFLLLWLRRIAIACIMAVGIGYLVIHLAVSPAISFDGRLYAAAARAWLEGGDPWAIEIQGIGLVAPPPSLLAAMPFALLPPELAGPATLAVAAVAAVVAVRLAKVGWWWLLDTPVAPSPRGRPRRELRPGHRCALDLGSPGRRIAPASPGRDGGCDEASRPSLLRQPPNEHPASCS